MALESITNISVDFSDKRYISINAKQLDRKSRFLSVTCRNYGEPFRLYSGEHAAFIRYKKPDGYSVYNMCEITSQGEIKVELTEQMLATVGICYADLVIVNKGNAVVDKDTGKITAIEDTGILSTMKFYIDVSETVVENSEVESSYEFDGLNDLLEKASADYSNVVTMSKSWAVGGTGKRDGENTNNAQHYSEQSMGYMEDASDSADSAKSYAVGGTGTRTGENTDNAKYYRDEAADSAGEASTSAYTAQIYAVGDPEVETTLKNNAKYYYEEARKYSIKSQRYAVGGTDSEDGENQDNSYYYYTNIKEYVNIAKGEINGAVTTAGENLSKHVDDAKKDMTTYVDDTKGEVIKYVDDIKTNMDTAQDNLNKYVDDTKNAIVELNEAAEKYSNLSIRYAIGDENDADTLEDNAKHYKEQAAEAAEAAKKDADLAQRYTIGDENDKSTLTDNAKYYYDVVKNIANGLNHPFIPMGTITFSELATAEKAVGFMYNISDDFVTDETFREGAGKSYTAGVNVYYTAENLWDCLSGEVAVMGIKGNNETTYRRGEVNLTPDNIGAISTADIATVDEVKEFLDIV